MSKYNVCDICNRPINTIDLVRNGFTTKIQEFDVTKSGRIIRRRKTICVCGSCGRTCTENLNSMKSQKHGNMTIGFSAPKENDYE